MTIVCLSHFRPPNLCSPPPGGDYSEESHMSLDRCEEALYSKAILKAEQWGYVFIFFNEFVG